MKKSILNIIKSIIIKSLLKLMGKWERSVKEAYNFEWREEILIQDNLPNQFNNFKILHLSDFHFINENDIHLKALIDQIKDQKYDIVFFTGDFRKGHTEPWNGPAKATKHLTDNIKSVNGIYAVYGNHDSPDIDNHLKNSKIHFLNNKCQVIHKGNEKLQICGVEDPYYHKKDRLDLIERDLNRDTYSIILCHTPDLADDFSKMSSDLYLAGHTHAGQLCLKKHQALISHTKTNYKYGLHKKKDMHINITAGVGTSLLPIRLNCPPEICTIILKVKNQNDS